MCVLCFVFMSVSAGFQEEVQLNSSTLRMYEIVGVSEKMLRIAQVQRDIPIYYYCCCCVCLLRLQLHVPHAWVGCAFLSPPLSPPLPPPPQYRMSQLDLD